MCERTSCRTARFNRLRGLIVAFLSMSIIVGAPGLLKQPAFAQQLDGPVGSFTMAQNWGSTFVWAWWWDGRLEVPEDDISTFPAVRSVPAPTPTDEAYYYTIDNDQLIGSLYLSDIALDAELCDDTCAWPGDGWCDDSGPGSSYSVCDFGTDCTDCGARAIPACDNTCTWPDDGACDDGGPGSSSSVCDFGTDCDDCGPRFGVMMDAMAGRLVVGNRGVGFRVFDATGTLETSATGDYRDVGWGPNGDLWVLTETQLLVYDIDTDTTSNPFGAWLDPTFENAQVFTFISTGFEGFDPATQLFDVAVVEEYAFEYQIREIGWYDPDYYSPPNGWVEVCSRWADWYPPMDIARAPYWLDYFYFFVPESDIIWRMDSWDDYDLCDDSQVIFADGSDGVDDPQQLFYYFAEDETGRLAVLMGDGEIIEYETDSGSPPPFRVLRPATTGIWAMTQDRYELEEFFLIELGTTDIQRLTRSTTYRFECDTADPIHIMPISYHEPGDSLALDTEEGGVCQSGSPYWPPPYLDGEVEGFIVHYGEAPTNPGFALTVTPTLDPYPPPSSILSAPTATAGEIG